MGEKLGGALVTEKPAKPDEKERLSLGDGRFFQPRRKNGRKLGR